MEDITIKSMIYYDREDDKENYKYKKVDATGPQEVKYEDGMFTFKFIRYYNTIIDGEEYIIVVDKDNRSYGFGMSETLRNLNIRAENGEKFKGYDREVIDEFIKMHGEEHTFWITGRNVLMLDYAQDKIPVKEVHSNTPDFDLDEDKKIDTKIEWYIEYKKHGDDKWYIKPTYCSDKKFRYDPTIEKYRFVKAAVYEINGTTYSDIIEREDKTYENNQEINNKDEVEEAIDGAKRLIYGKDESSEMFAGYTRIYPFNTEDSSSVFKLKEEKIRDKDVLTVTGSGDALLDLFMSGANTVTCFDINGLAKFYALLKFSFVKAGMSYKEYKDFFLGKSTTILSKDIYDKYSSSLDESTKKFWDSIYEYLNTNNKKLLNSEHNLFYKIYSFFDNANCSYQNNCSYMGNEENYAKLQETIKSKSSEDIKFVDCSLFDLPERLAGNKYDYAYLSNILDFTELYYESKDELERKNCFKQFILDDLTRIISDNGTIDVGFIAKNWQEGTTYLNTTMAFGEEDGFTIRELSPYNEEDKVIVYSNKKLQLNEGATYK